MDIRKVQTGIRSITAIIGIGNVVVDSKLALIVHMSIRLGHVIVATLRGTQEIT